MLNKDKQHFIYKTNRALAQTNVLLAFGGNSKFEFESSN